MQLLVWSMYSCIQLYPHGRMSMAVYTTRYTYCSVHSSTTRGYVHHTLLEYYSSTKFSRSTRHRSHAYFPKLVGRRFTFGREYCIAIENPDGTSHRIRYRLPESVTVFLSSEMHSEESLFGSFLPGGKASSTVLAGIAICSWYINSGWVLCKIASKSCGIQWIRWIRWIRFFRSS